MSANKLETLRDTWRELWPHALSLWSTYARLSEPRWCLTHKEAKQEHLTMSFAMIRLTDHAVVLNMQDIAERGLQAFPVEIMAHEIGHHIYCPGDLTDQGRLLARVRRGLPGVEEHAPMIANLYADLFINDRLQRSHDLHLDRIYAKLGDDGSSVLWRIYLRMYEILWQLERGALVKTALNAAQEGDAQLGARMIRVYARDWMKGASSFGALCLTYLTKDEGGKLRKAASRLLDSESDQGGDGGELPDGLSGIDDDELEPVLHPSEDPLVAGEKADRDAAGPQGEDDADHSKDPGGQKSEKNFRDISEYRELIKQLNGKASDIDITLRYYRERAMPYLIRFPVKETPLAQEPMPEGLETWDIGRPLTEVDWVESVVMSPHVVPGVTTLARVHGDTPGSDPRKEPFDLYVGIDCSGSMPNPTLNLSYPVLAGFIVTLSALRAGGRVMACLSGEVGKSIATEGFMREQAPVLGLMTQYLGTGYSYGIFRLDDMVAELNKARASRTRPVHILIVTDRDIFTSLESNAGKGKVRQGWTAAQEALQAAGGGGTMLLNAVPQKGDKHAERILKQGWRIAYVSDWAEVLEFARKFSSDLWGQVGQVKR
jgi:hypothetical protein